MLVGVLASAHADERAAGCLDLLSYRHEVAVTTDDDDGPDVIEARHVLDRVETELDVGAVLC